jgi:CHASE3 domain sensor protein
MRRSCEIIGTPAPVATVMNLIDRYEEQVNSLVSDDEDLVAYVERLETMSDNGMNLDDEVDDDQLQFDFAADKMDGESGAETLMDEVEQFLRDQGEGK